MIFDPPLKQGTLVERYKRFTTTLRLDDGSLIQAHCPNSGSLRTLNEPGSEVLFSKSSNPLRKLAFTLEMIRHDHTWVGINTSHTNALALEGITTGVIKELQGYESITGEAWINPKTRLDYKLTYANQPITYVEVKTVTLKDGDVALFPDSVTTRGLKHLKTLIDLKKSGYRTLMLYVIMRNDCTNFAPACLIDPSYAQGFKEAIDSGVEMLAYSCTLGPKKISIDKKIPV